MRAKNKIDSDGANIDSGSDDFFGIEEFAKEGEVHTGNIFEGVGSDTLKNFSTDRSKTKKLEKVFEYEYEEVDTANDKQVPTAFAQIRYDNENRPSKHGQYESGLGEISYPSRRRLSRTSIDPRRLETSSRKLDEVVRDASSDTRASSRYIKTNEAKRERYSSMFTSKEDLIRKNSLKYPVKTPRSDIIEDESVHYDSSSVVDNEIDSEDPYSAAEPDPERFEDEGEQSAYDVVHRMRIDKQQAKLKEMLKNDKDGSLMSLHKIWSLIPPLHQFTKKEVLDLLVQSVIYNQDGIIALNKPYDLPSIGGAGVKMSLSSFLEDLRQKIAPDSKRLFLAHRLDKSTTGVILLTTSEERLRDLKQLFAKRTMTKRYWCVVRGFVEPADGIIDIPLSETEIGGTYKMLPVPRKSEQNKEVVRERANRIAFKAVTEYKTLATASGCSLVETNIVTGVKHQIRSHMGYCMNRPILGDHKYSHYMKLLPQRLAPVTLQQLGIRAAKSRHLPIYLHAREVIIPEASNGVNIFIKAPVPKFFLFTLKRLKLVL